MVEYIVELVGLVSLQTASNSFRPGGKHLLFTDCSGFRIPTDPGQKQMDVLFVQK